MAARCHDMPVIQSQDPVCMAQRTGALAEDAARRPPGRDVKTAKPGCTISGQAGRAREALPG